MSEPGPNKANAGFNFIKWTILGALGLMFFEAVVK